MRTLFDNNRYFLKDSVRQTIDFSQTDQSRGIAAPPIEKPYAVNSQRIDLVSKEEWHDVPQRDLVSAIQDRRSHRHYKPESLTLEEISFLLWATQGLRQVTNGGVAYRTVPSAGCRHALETYLCILKVTGLEMGIYRYLPIEHQLLVVSHEKDLPNKIVAATLHQSFTGKAPVTFIWSTIPYRMEWRYHLAAHKAIALDAGHVCQNLYLASSAIGAGTCAIAAYHQELMDMLLNIDGDNEFTVYLAALGKI